MYISLKKFGYMAIAFMLAISMGALGVMASPSTASATSEDAGVTSFTVKVDGTNINETFNKERLSSTTLNGKAVLNTGTLPAEFRKNAGSGSYPWYVMQIKDFVTLDDLFAVAGASSYWRPGAVLEFTVMNEVNGQYVEKTYEKYTYSYNDMVTQNRFYKYLKEDGKFLNGLDTYDACPAAIGFSRAERIIRSNASTTALQITSSDYTTTTQFVMGIDESALDSGSTNAGGNRFATSITGITIYPNGK
jgi:hypothetical protein